MLESLATATGIQLGVLGVGLVPSDGWVTPTDIPSSEADALKLLYDLTDGDNWTDNTNWGTDTTANNWFGVNVAGENVEDIDLGGNNLNGSVATFQINDFSSIDDFRLDQTSTSGDISSWVLSASQRIFRIQTTNISGAPILTSAVVLLQYFYQNCSLSQANVDAVLQEIYDNRFNFTQSTPFLNIGGTNSAPSAAGLALIVILTTDPGAEGFNTWAITSTAP